MADEQRELSGAVDAMKLNGEQTCNGDHQDTDTYETTWGFPRNELYKLALQFYKGTHRSFTCQINCAEANADADELTGYLAASRGLGLLLVFHPLSVRSLFRVADTIRADSS